MAGSLLPDLLRPVLEQISKLWSRVDLMPTIRWGTITQASPLRVQLDGDAAPLTVTPMTVVRGLAVGARVVCVEQHRRVLVIAGNGVARFMAQAIATGRVYIGTTDTATGAGGTYIALSPAADSVVNALWVNHDGTEVFRIRKDGHIDAPHSAYASARGSVATSATGYTTVTLPAGRFTVAPRIVAGNGTQGTVGVSRVINITATSFQIAVWSLGGAQIAASGVDWEASQATATAASG